MNADRPAPTLYAPPTTGAAIDLFLDANEGPGGCVDLARLVASLGADKVRRYPGPAWFEQKLAGRFGVDAARVLVTAGGDEAIDRACRAFLGPDRELILPVPTFEMIDRYARLTHAKVVTTDWPQGPYPLDAVLRLANERTALIAVVTPNNPTGATATAGDLEQLAAAVPNAVLLVDLAYTEFADEDLTGRALALPNAVVIRTFSKAFGLAGLRTGFAIGSPANIRAMRASGSPFPVSALSLAAANEALQRTDEYLPTLVKRIRAERERLYALLAQLGARPRRSQANFVLAEFDDAERVWRDLAGLGIGVRRFHNAAGLENALRITCPGDDAAFERLCSSLQNVLERRPK